MTFREIAARYLSLSGYSHAALTDGPRDGGSDIGLYQLGGNPEPLAVQVSVQRKGWQSKVRRDAQTAAEKLGRNHLVYITSRRIPNVDSQALAEDLWDKQGVTLRVIDGPAVTSRFSELSKLSELTELLNLPGAATRGRKESAREDLAYSYAFFGSDAASFRESGIESAIASYVGRAKAPPSRDEIAAGVTRALGLGKNRNKSVLGQIDAMAQRGELLKAGTGMKLSDRLDDERRTARTLRNAEWNRLSKVLRDILVAAQLTGAALQACEETVRSCAGGLMLQAGAVTAAAAQPRTDQGPARRQMRDQLRKLESSFLNYGVDEDAAKALTQDLMVAIASSVFGQSLLAGEVFLSLVDLEKSELFRALGGQRGLEIFLDASVAIPILASLLYEAHDEHFFTAATHMYEQADALDIPLFLPQYYLEEAASHLLEAWEDYRAIIDVDPDLEFSKNAFVGHFLAIRRNGRQDLAFDTYVKSFGLRTSAGPTRTFRVERDWIMSRMRVLFSRYKVTTTDPGVITSEARKAAQSAITFTANELGKERAGLLLEHDANAVAEISSRAATGDLAVAFCTWDQIHLQLQNAAGAVEWSALDPVALGDLLSLARPDDDQPLRSAIDIALEFGEAEARRGAEVWDELINIEGANLYDAELLERAKKFKTEYIRDVVRGTKVAPLAVAWNEWKGRTR